MIVDQILVGTKKEILDYFKKNLNYVGSTKSLRRDYFTCDINKDLTLKKQIESISENKGIKQFQVFYLEHSDSHLKFDGLINPNKKVNKRLESDIVLVLKSKYIRIIDRQEVNGLKNINRAHKKGK